MPTITRKLDGKTYAFDGRGWFAVSDYSRPPLRVSNELDRSLPAGERLALRIQLKRDGELPLRHFLGYHSPEVMRRSAEECDGLGFLTSKDFGDPTGDVLWFVAKRRGCKRHFLRSYFVIERVEPAHDPDFDHRFVGSESRAGLFDPMPELTDIDWFREWFPGTTCARGFGMDEMNRFAAENFTRFAAESGSPFTY